MCYNSGMDFRQSLRLGLTVILCFLSMTASAGVFAAEGWQSFSLPHQVLFYRDPALQEKVEAFAQENEQFLALVQSTFPNSKEVDPVESYIFTDWTGALQGNLQLPESTVWNVYEEGVFERYAEQSLLFRRAVASSVDFLHNGALNLLRMRQRGQNPHDPALLLLQVKQLDPPEVMMYRPTSQMAQATFTSFLTFLLDKEGSAKLQTLLTSLNDANYFFIDRGGGEGRNTHLFPQTIAAIYGRPLEDLSAEWRKALEEMSPASLSLDPVRYSEAMQYVNVVGLRYYQWQDLYNFPALMRDMTQLFYYFDRLDLARSEPLIQKIEMEQAEGQWEAGRTTRAIIWSAVGVALLLLGAIVWLLYRDYRRRQRIRQFLATHPTDQKGFDLFLHDQLGKPWGKPNEPDPRD
jgi:hypothetical protein